MHAQPGTAPIKYFMADKKETIMWLRQTTVEVSYENANTSHYSYHFFDECIEILQAKILIIGYFSRSSKKTS